VRAATTQPPMSSIRVQLEPPDSESQAAAPGGPQPARAADRRRCEPAAARRGRSRSDSDGRSRHAAGPDGPPGSSHSESPAPASSSVRRGAPGENGRPRQHPAGAPLHGVTQPAPAACGVPGLSPRPAAAAGRCRVDPSRSTPQGSGEERRRDLSLGEQCISYGEATSGRGFSAGWDPVGW
jgi:hypothetical protein